MVRRMVNGKTNCILFIQVVNSTIISMACMVNVVARCGERGKLVSPFNFKSGSSSCNLELQLHHYDVMVVAIGA